MGQLTPAQRHALYIQEATRSGIHKPILAALYQVQTQPSLTDGETGLGIAPANQTTLEQVDTFVAQIQYAANTVRSLTHSLIAAGWTSVELWNGEAGRYTDQFIEAIAAGYTAPLSDQSAALLEACDQTALLQAYSDDLKVDAQIAQMPLSFSYLDAALLAFLEALPYSYFSLPHQRHALLELVRLWRQLDQHEDAIALLDIELADPSAIVDDAKLDSALRRFLLLVAPAYAGYPHQREALLRLTQLWQQLDSREAAIVALSKPLSPSLSFNSIDAALMAVVQSLPYTYEGRGDQRNALVEAFRLWHQLESRSATLIELGIDPDLFTIEAPNQTAIAHAAAQLDQALLDFMRRLPTLYRATDRQRDAMLRLTQFWRSLSTPEQALQSLLNDLKQMSTARRDTPEAPPKPVPITPSARPDRWTPDTLQLYAAIVPNGSFTWAEATAGGLQIPPNQATVDAIVRLAQLIQQARDRLGRPLHVTHWYLTAASNVERTASVSRRHHLGDALTFYCEGITGAQLYWFLDPWWTGGLGYDAQLPLLCYVDARRDRARWQA
ncbi:peptidase M15A [Stenomitos frigidus ULC18]|uniref:Peptidase M15A n=2 Tax=Stenomitos TaxID=1844270 RepID=A0A2T1ELX0_9CYAN|nr:peptidase M15A [Stenomitos frigidus ULC18]